MKTFVVILAVLSMFGAVLVKGFDKQAAIAEFMAKAEVCKGKVGAKDADVAEMAARKPASTPEGKCLRACLMKSCGVMDGNGKFVKAVAVKHAEEFADGDANKIKIANEIIDVCSGLSLSDDPCEAASQLCNCFKEQTAAHGITDFKM